MRSALGAGRFRMVRQLLVEYFALEFCVSHQSRNSWFKHECLCHQIPSRSSSESISTDMSASVQECDRELGFQQLTLPPADSLSDAASRRSLAPRSMSTTAHA